MCLFQVQTPPERDTGPGSPQSPDKVMTAPTAFTVDFGGEDSSVKIKDGVSGYLPPRLRRSLRQRAPKRDDSVESEEVRLYTLTHWNIYITYHIKHIASHVSNL